MDSLAIRQPVAGNTLSMWPGIGSRAGIHLIPIKPKTPRTRAFAAYRPATWNTSGPPIRQWSQFLHISRKNTRSVCVSKRRLKTCYLAYTHTHTTHIHTAVRIFEYIILVSLPYLTLIPFLQGPRETIDSSMHKSKGRQQAGDKPLISTQICH